MAVLEIFIHQIGQDLKALCHTDCNVNGHEYTNLWRNPVLIPEVERLSELRKKLKGHGIKRIRSMNWLWL